MTSSSEAGGTAQPASSDRDDDAVAAPVPPAVAQERTDGPEDSAEFAARLDVDPERDGVKG